MGELYKIRNLERKCRKISPMTDDIERRRNLTFSQAEGLAELPRQLALGEMPHGFRVEAHSLVSQSILSTAHSSKILCEDWHKIVTQLWVGYFYLPYYDFNYGMPFESTAKMTRVILDCPFNEVFDFLTALVRHDNCPPEVRDEIARLLRKHRMAYYLDTNGTPTFIPQSSPQEGDAVRAAMGVLAAESGMDGARAHLFKAAGAINEGRFADAVRESIHAVESVAKVISGKADATLGDAIKELQERGLLTHGALAEGFKKLYGYTSDEEGIRHALSEKGDANVDEEEALFMFGACASFCSYLCRKRRKMSETP